MSRTEKYSPVEKNILLAIKLAFPYLAPIDIADVFLQQTGRRISTTSVYRILTKADVPANAPGRPELETQEQKKETLHRNVKIT